LLALEALQEPQSIRRWRRLAIAGTVTALSSVSAVFTLSGVVPALASEGEIRRDTAALRRLALVGAGWLVLLGLSYVLIYRPAAGSPYMQRYWTPYFLTPLGVEQSGFLIGTAFTDFFLALGGIWRVSAALLFLVPLTVGLVRLWRDQGASKALLVGLPLAAVIGASVLRFYPFASRLLLFGAASTIILIAAGLDDLADRVGRIVKGPWLALGGAAILMFAVLDAPAASLIRRGAMIWDRSSRSLRRTINQEPRSMFSIGRFLPGFTTPRTGSTRRTPHGSALSATWSAPVAAHFAMRRAGEVR
jgi:hypothetical protein